MNTLLKADYKLGRWLWLIGNKKPPKKWEAYITVTGLWFFAGLIIPLSLLVFTSTQLEMVERIVMGIAGLLLATLCVTISIRENMGRGTIDKIHEASLEHWHKMNKKYSIE